MPEQKNRYSVQNPNQVIVEKNNITAEDAKLGRYPDSKEPGVHSDSAPIGGG